MINVTVWGGQGEDCRWGENEQVIHPKPDDWSILKQAPANRLTKASRAQVGQSKKKTASSGKMGVMLVDDHKVGMLAAMNDEEEQPHVRREMETSTKEMIAQFWMRWSGLLMMKWRDVRLNGNDHAPAVLRVTVDGCTCLHVVQGQVLAICAVCMVWSEMDGWKGIEMNSFISEIDLAM